MAGPLFLLRRLQGGARRHAGALVLVITISRVLPSSAPAIGPSKLA